MPLRQRAPRPEAPARYGAPHNIVAHTLLVVWPRLGIWLHDRTRAMVARWGHTAPPEELDTARPLTFDDVRGFVLTDEGRDDLYGVLHAAREAFCLAGHHVPPAQAARIDRLIRDVDRLGSTYSLPGQWSDDARTHEDPPLAPELADALAANREAAWTEREHLLDDARMVRAAAGRVLAMVDEGHGMEAEVARRVVRDRPQA